MGKKNKRSCNRRKERHNQLIEDRIMDRLYEEAKKLDIDYLNTVDGQMYGDIDAINKSTQTKEYKKHNNIFSWFYPSNLFSWIMV